jgi:hypothetical protein
VEVKALQGFSMTTGGNTFTFANEPDLRAGDYIYFNGIILRVRSYSVLTGTTYVNYTGATQSAVDIFAIRFRENNITPRIAIINQSKTTSHDLNINGFPDASPSTQTMYEAEFVNLVCENIYSQYYESLLTAFQTPSVNYVWMRFSTQDLYTLDMTKPVFSSVLNGTFYINKIEQWKVNKPCLVELVRINKLI